jgi:hypothetical protein
MEKDNNESNNHFSNEFTDKLSLTKTYHDFFQNVQVKLNTFLNLYTCTQKLYNI